MYNDAVDMMSIMIMLSSEVLMRYVVFLKMAIDISCWSKRFKQSVVIVMIRYFCRGEDRPANHDFCYTIPNIFQTQTTACSLQD